MSSQLLAASGRPRFSSDPAMLSAWRIWRRLARRRLSLTMRANVVAAQLCACQLMCQRDRHRMQEKKPITTTPYAGLKSLAERGEYTLREPRSTSAATVWRPDSDLSSPTTGVMPACYAGASHRLCSYFSNNAEMSSSVTNLDDAGGSSFEELYVATGTFGMPRALLAKILALRSAACSLRIASWDIW